MPIIVLIVPAPTRKITAVKKPDRNKIVLVLMIALAISLIQVSTVIVALDSIGKALGASSAQLQWVLSGYALMIGLTLVPAGRLGDIFGQTKIFTVGLILFTVASALCGLATNATVLNLMRLLQGAASGIFSPQVTGMIQRYFDGQARARAYALFGLVVSASVAAGPLLAGLVIKLLGPELGWRVTFAINLPLGVIGVIIALMWLPFADDHKDREARIARDGGRRKLDLDLVGATLLVVAVLFIMLPFMWGEKPLVWLLVPASVVLLAVWVWWEIRYEKGGGEPMVTMSLFRIRSFSFATGVTFLQFMGMTSQFVIANMFVQSGLGYSALIAGMLGLPNAIASAVASMWSGKYTIRYGRKIMLGALFLMVFGLGTAIAVLLGIQRGVPFWLLSLALAVSGLGQGAMGSAAQTQGMLEVPALEGATAGGVMQTAQRIATAIGNTMITGVLFAILTYFGSRGTYAWVTATIGAYAAIIVLLVFAIAAAIWFVRDGKR